MQTEIVYQGVHNHHKILVVKHTRDTVFDDISQTFISRPYYCGYVSLNRVDDKVKLGVSNGFIYDWMEENAVVFGGVTHTGPLDSVVNFAGNLIGFDTNYATLDSNLTEKEVIAETKSLANQLVSLENKILNNELK